MAGQDRGGDGIAWYQAVPGDLSSPVQSTASGTPVQWSQGASHWSCGLRQSAVKNMDNGGPGTLSLLTPQTPSLQTESFSWSDNTS